MVEALPDRTNSVSPYAIYLSHYRKMPWLEYSKTGFLSKISGGFLLQILSIRLSKKIKKVRMRGSTV